MGCVKREPRLLKVIQRETGGASALNASPAIAFGIVAGMPFALTLDPLGDFEFVRKLKHRLLLSEMTREPCR
jgi:hypothetical protein